MEMPNGSLEHLRLGQDASGHTVSTGVYFYRMQFDDFVESKSMLLLKHCHRISAGRQRQL